MNKFMLAVLLVFFQVISYGQLNKRPKLIVGIVVEQMRYDFLTRYWDKYSDNGFKLLMKKGAVFHNARYDYLNINSVSSLANIATGTYPYMHGIIGRQWYDRKQGKMVNAVEDRETFLVGKKGVGFAGSPLNLQVQTFSDQLSLTTFGASKIVVIAPTMEQAIVSGGKFADEVYWFDTQRGTWVSSSYYFKSSLELPAWVRNFNKRKFPDTYLKQQWNTLYNLSAYKESLPDESLGEKGLEGQTVFPYDLKKLKKHDTKYELFTHTPFFNTYIKDFAISSLVYDQVGRDNVTDYLFIVFPATAYVSERFGIRSVETEDAYLRLDKDIAHLIIALDDIIGKDNYILFLTSDRGACDNPALLKNLGQQVLFFDPLGTKLILDSYLRAIYKQSGLVENISNNQVYLNQGLIDQNRIDPAEIQRYAASFFAQFKAVQYAFPAQLFNNNSFSTDILSLAFHSYNPQRSGDVIFSLRPDAFLENPDHTLPSFSECYGYCNDKNHLPLIFYGKGIKHADIYKPADITSIAPTLSLLLNIQLPGSSTVDPLTDLLKQAGDL